MHVGMKDSENIRNNRVESILKIDYKFACKLAQNGYEHASVLI